MTITQYFQPPDRDDSKQDSQGSVPFSDSSSDKPELNYFVEDGTEPLTSKSTKGPTTNLITKAFFFRWMNLINFLVIQRSKFSLKEFLLQGFVFSFSFGIGLASKDFLFKKDGNTNFPNFSQPLITTAAKFEQLPQPPFSFKRHIQKRLKNIEQVDDHKTLEKENFSNKDFSKMYLDDKQQFFQSFNQLILDYSKTIEPVSRFKVHFKTFMGLQITSNKKTSLLTTSLANRFDDLSNSNSGELSTADSIDSNSNVVGIPIFAKLIKDVITDFPSFKEKYQIRPVFLFGISFDYRAK